MYLNFVLFTDCLYIIILLYIRIPISDKAITTLHDSVTIVFLILAVVTYIIKYKEDKCTKMSAAC